MSAVGGGLRPLALASPAEPIGWPASPERIALADDEVQVWIAELAAPPARPERFWESLDAGERARAETFRFRRHRDAYVVCRGVLRRLLGALLEVPPGRLRLAYGPHGKPALVGSVSDGIRFNVSRSGGLALFAMARGRELGVDLERIRPGISREAIAERFFSPAEVGSLRALPSEVQDEAFFACWTRKEAYVKARGEGLSVPLDRFTFSLLPGEPAALLEGPAEDVGRWTFRDISPGAGWAGTLAVDGAGLRLFRWRWDASELGRLPLTRGPF